MHYNLRDLVYVDSGYYESYSKQKPFYRGSTILSHGKLSLFYGLVLLLCILLEGVMQITRAKNMMA